MGAGIDRPDARRAASVSRCVSMTSKGSRHGRHFPFRDCKLAGSAHRDVKTSAASETNGRSSSVSAISRLFVVILVVGFGAKQFLFSPKAAVADANQRAGDGILSKMHRESVVHDDSCAEDE